MNYITEKERLENEIGSLKIQNNFMQGQINELLLVKSDLQKRLLHLFQSEFIRSFDELNLNTGKYKRDIKEADEITRPIKHGHWIMCDEQYNAYECSICHDAWAVEEGSPSENNMHYCQNCGAKMDEEVKND